MATDEEKTMKLVTNLDRKAIEGKLAQVRTDAQSANLKELADMFSGIEGMPRAQIEQRVKNALKWLADKPQHNRIASQLELVGLNLPSLGVSAAPASTSAAFRRSFSPTLRTGARTSTSPRPTDGPSVHPPSSRASIGKRCSGTRIARSR